MSQLIHGRATIRVNGTVIESEEDASIQPGGVKNNHKMIGQKGFYNQNSLGSKVVCKVAATVDFSIADYQNMGPVEITFESDNGRTWIITDAVQTKELDLAGGTSGGTVELNFEGSPAQEMT